jgi:hypothetical protein
MGAGTGLGDVEEERSEPYRDSNTGLSTIPVTGEKFMRAN